MSEMMKWHQELDVFYRIKSGIILEGNIADCYLYNEGDFPLGMIPLKDYLHHFFQRRGYETIVYFDEIRGFYSSDTLDSQHNELRKFASLCGVNYSERMQYFLTQKSNSAPELIGTALQQTEEPVVIVMDMASRYIAGPDRMTMDDVKAFTQLQCAVANARMTTNKRLRNLLVFITNKQNDLPAWFFLNNPSLKTLDLGLPTAKERRAMLTENDNLGFWEYFDGEVRRQDEPEYRQDATALNRLIDRFVARTEGFTNSELRDLKTLCRIRKIRVHDICSLVDLYSYGKDDNPWQDQALFKKLTEGQAGLERRVKGQEAAVQQTMDVIKRSVIGLSGSQHSSHSKPKGVLFFAGPTGTGKTETAKALAEMIFGDESSCIRFDMSEYSQSHSDQRLLGAPPGYVGYEAGGQLTNAVRKNPFSILLFDEIEKAAPSIMDKFLQILEDGRMTDGQGHTVYFSECVIIFTSNLGIFVKGPEDELIPNVNKDMPYETVRDRVRSAIENYFKLQLGRPEILNRIGENIVVFDYIHPDVAEQILLGKMEKLKENMKENMNCDLDWEPEVFRKLKELVCKNLDNGGRGVGNVMESAWINPLSRWMFDHRVQKNATINVTDIDTLSVPIQLTCEVK